MGRTAPSSKRKSSKKKSSKMSSEARRSKRSRRNKSKKLSRRDDYSSYSDDESTSSMSVLSNSSEDDYTSRRARSHKRSNVKSSRKRARRSSSSPERSKDALQVKRKKGSKRKHRDSERSKKRKYKKSQRDASVSSRSSDSRSTSTCGGGSTSCSGESEFKRLRGRSREKRKDKGDSGRARSRTKKRKNRSLSCSSRSWFSDGSGDDSKEKVAVEVNSRRLRSIITVTRQAEEKDENERERDVHTEEIVYDHDDYPSRSNDSNDGGNKRELVHQSSVESEKRRRLENVIGEAALVSKLAMNKSTVSGNSEGGQLLKAEKISPSDGVGMDNPKKKNENDVSATVVGDDLESILRQKALENLKRFRGGRQTNEKPRADEEKKSDVNLKQLSAAKAEVVQSKSPKQEDSSLVGAAQFVGQNRRPKLSRDLSATTRTEGKTMDRKESLPTRAEGKILDGKESLPTRAERKIPDRRYIGIEPGATQQSDVCPPRDGEAHSDILKEKDRSAAHAVSLKSESSVSKLRQESLGTGSPLKPVPTSQASPKASSLVIKSTVNNVAAETYQTTGETSRNNLIGVTDAHGSTATEPLSGVKPSSEEHSSREGQGQAKDSSQFEQKTMSVMRGGEMVQVSYKVYIPKKAPALARRQLQR